MGLIEEQVREGRRGAKEPSDLDQTEADNCPSRSKRRKILVVDDDHTIMALIRESLKDHGLQVLTCDNLAKAEQLIYEEERIC